MLFFNFKNMNNISLGVLRELHNSCIQMHITHVLLEATKVPSCLKKKCCFHKK